MSLCTHTSKFKLVGMLLLALCILQLSEGCKSDEKHPVKIEPAHIEEMDDGGLKRLTLTEKAVQRLDIKLAPVTEESVPARQNKIQKVVPYSSILYDTHGNTFVYKNESPLVFVRHKIVVDFIKEDHVVLLDGPPTGTMVVTVGAAELYGTEYEVGH